MRSRLNTNRKSYLASETLLWLCCSDDRKCPKSTALGSVTTTTYRGKFLTDNVSCLRGIA